MHLDPEEIRRLSPRERLDLIDDLWDSLSDGDIPLTPAQEAELDRRLDSYEQDKAHAITWEELKAQLARRT